MLQHVIDQAIAHAFAIPSQELWSPRRGRSHVAFARQVAMYLAHVACRLTFTQVVLMFARDRTTVAHACGVVEDRRDDASFDRSLELLEHVVQTLCASPLCAAQPCIVAPVR